MYAYWWHDWQEAVRCCKLWSLTVHLLQLTGLSGHMEFCWINNQFGIFHVVVLRERITERKKKKWNCVLENGDYNLQLTYIVVFLISFILLTRTVHGLVLVGKLNCHNSLIKLNWNDMKVCYTGSVVPNQMGNTLTNNWTDSFVNQTVPNYYYYY